jgi:hypothetical protein
MYMFLRGLKDKFKYKSGLKFLKKELGTPAAVPDRPRGIYSLGVIVDMDAFEKVERFHEFTEYFGLRPNAIKVIGYRSYYDTNSPYATPVFSEKDLGWNGAIDNGYANEFLSREYDLLVNYYTAPNLMLQLMSIRTRARLRVGFMEQDSAYNDLILQVPMGDFKTFRTELQKYLKVLKEIA